MLTLLVVIAPPATRCLWHPCHPSKPQLPKPIVRSESYCHWLLAQRPQGRAPVAALEMKHTSLPSVLQLLPKVLRVVASVPRPPPMLIRPDHQGGTHGRQKHRSSNSTPQTNQALAWMILLKVAVKATAKPVPMTGRPLLQVQQATALQPAAPPHHRRNAKRKYGTLQNWWPLHLLPRTPHSPQLGQGNTQPPIVALAASWRLSAVHHRRQPPANHACGMRTAQ
mmetsp:Transcript_3824/g.7626  ORF Transcript_3824/g.7626 Transcript_3824/m.7626 type:complete len:224 (-) Transcript_3824:91-762(-)